MARKTLLARADRAHESPRPTHSKPPVAGCWGPRRKLVESPEYRAAVEETVLAISEENDGREVYFVLDTTDPDEAARRVRRQDRDSDPRIVSSSRVRQQRAAREWEITHAAEERVTVTPD